MATEFGMRIIAVAWCCLSLLFFGVILATAAADSSPCGNDGWQSYKDEKCFRILDDTQRTFDQAKKACEDSNGSLVVIHSLEEQKFVVNFLFNIQKQVDHFWLGGRFSGEDQVKFHWIDGSDVTFTNWTQTLVPKGNRGGNDTLCVQLQRSGGWAGEPCAQKRPTVCQRMPSWSMAQMVRQVLETKQALSDAKAKHEADIAELRLQLNRLPIGFVYTQLPGQKTPSELFGSSSSMSWTEVSQDYAGVFFRVAGGGSAQFGTGVQQENVPGIVDRVEVHHESFLAERHIERVEGFDNVGVDLVNGTGGAGDGWTKALFTGGLSTPNHFHRYHTRSGELRPRNMAIRLWKRTA